MGEASAGVDVVFSQEELLIEGGESNERHVVEGVELLLAVLAVGTLGTVAMPVGRGRERRTRRTPHIVGGDDTQTLVVKLVVALQIKTRVTLTFQVEPPEFSLSVDDRTPRRGVRVAQRAKNA